MNIINLGVCVYDYGVGILVKIVKIIGQYLVSCVQLVLVKFFLFINEELGQIIFGFVNYVCDEFVWQNINIVVLGCYINLIYFDLFLCELFL